MEILQNLLENEILNDETKAELEEAIQSQISEAVETAVNEAKAEVEAEVRAELAEQFVSDKEALVEALDTKVQQFLESELVELKDDIEKFRDLEAEYAEKIVAEKANLAEVVKKDFTTLVNILNEFLEDRVTAEFEELREDINEVKKIRFGEKIYESVKETFEYDFFDKDAMDRTVKEAKTELKRAQKELKESQAKLASMERKHVLNETLSTLSGKPREVMNAILANTPTDKIPTVHEQFIGRVLNESVVEEDAEKESKVLAEESSTNGEKVVESVEEETVSVTGDAGEDVKVVTESEDNDLPRLSPEEQQRLRDLSGQFD